MDAMGFQLRPRVVLGSELFVARPEVGLGNVPQEKATAVIFRRHRLGRRACRNFLRNAWQIRRADTHWRSDL
jgi:hypothetical protein